MLTGSDFAYNRTISQAIVEAAKGNKKVGKGGIRPVQDRPILSRFALQASTFMQANLFRSDFKRLSSIRDTTR